MKNVLKPLAKRFLIPLVLPVASSAIDAAIHKKMFGTGCRPLDLAWRPSDLASRTAILRNSNEEMNDIMRIFKSLEESGLLIKGV